ncbi:MAG: phosphatidate cytidylyltransferase [Acetobacteraceae bacterium]|nr:phosphatidate cytidylyltransferase [Acetobacteraceae bacterium]
MERRILPPRCRNSLDGSGALARDLPDARTFQWADLGQRIASAAILAPLALSALWVGAAFWAGVIGVVAIGLACEWVQLCGVRVSSVPGLAVPGIVILAWAAGVEQYDREALVLLLAGFAALWILTRGDRVRSRQDLGRFRHLLAFGIPYIGASVIAVIWLRSDELAGRPNVLFLVLTVWASDVGAYCTGRLIGGPRLAPRISPAKTWAGTTGGLGAAIGIGIVVAVLTSEERSLWRIALVAALLGIFTQAGDLLESVIKRRLGVKDSSQLIPGHGGLLDRLDGMLIAAPAAAILALTLGRGVVLWEW